MDNFDLVWDKIVFVQDKSNFVWAEGRGINLDVVAKTQQPNVRYFTFLNVSEN